MRAGYLRNGKPYDDGHTRKSWSYWFMEMVRKRHAMRVRFDVYRSVPGIKYGSQPMPKWNGVSAGILQ